MLHGDALFEIRESLDGACLVAVGEIDMSSGPAFAAAISRMMSTRGEVVVDMSGVSFMDSSGLNVLCTAAQQGPVRLCQLQDQVRHLLALTGLENTFAELKSA